VKIKLTTNARRRLAQVREFYSLKGYHEKGNRTVRELIKHTKKLISQPKMGLVHEELSGGDKTYRVLIVHRDHKVIYRIEGELILIVEIFDVRQDPDNIKSE